MDPICGFTTTACVIADIRSLGSKTGNNECDNGSPESSRVAHDYFTAHRAFGKNKVWPTARTSRQCQLDALLPRRGPSQTHEALGVVVEGPNTGRDELSIRPSAFDLHL